MAEFKQIHDSLFALEALFLGVPLTLYLIKSKSYWSNRLFFAGAETALEQGGYLDGAVEAAKRVVHLLSQTF